MAIRMTSATKFMNLVTSFHPHVMVYPKNSNWLALILEDSPYHVIFRLALQTFSQMQALTADDDNPFAKPIILHQIPLNYSCLFVHLIHEWAKCSECKYACVMNSAQ